MKRARERDERVSLDENDSPGLGGGEGREEAPELQHGALGMMSMEVVEGRMARADWIVNVSSLRYPLSLSLNNSERRELTARGVRSAEDSNSLHGAVCKKRGVGEVGVGGKKSARRLSLALLAI